jgi:hypothetical protein
MNKYTANVLIITSFCISSIFMQSTIAIEQNAIKKINFAFKQCEKILQTKIPRNQISLKVLLRYYKKYEKYRDIALNIDKNVLNFKEPYNGGEILINKTYQETYDICEKKLPKKISKANNNVNPTQKINNKKNDDNVIDKKEVIENENSDVIDDEEVTEDEDNDVIDDEEMIENEDNDVADDEETAEDENNDVIDDEEIAEDENNDITDKEVTEDEDNNITDEKEAENSGDIINDKKITKNKANKEKNTIDSKKVIVKEKIQVVIKKPKELIINPYDIYLNEFIEQISGEFLKTIKNEGRIPDYIYNKKKTTIWQYELNNGYICKVYEFNNNSLVKSQILTSECPEL